jgi:hypothetical protein
MDNVFFTRANFISSHIGQTSAKTQNLLSSQLNNMICVNDAHTLYLSSYDIFGEEALIAISQFLSQHQGQITVIFRGDPYLLRNGVFSVVPALKHQVFWKNED